MRRRGLWQVAFALSLLSAVLTACSAAQSQTSSKPNAIHYTISLAQAADHLVGVDIDLPSGASERELQLPVWNALYQVRDFSQYVNWIEGRDNDGRPVPLLELTKSLWRVSGVDHGARIRYQIYADLPGPYGAQLDSTHAFFNLAEILMYSVEERSSPVLLRITDFPQRWKVATALEQSGTDHAQEINHRAIPVKNADTTTGHPGVDFEAKNYDQLVDSPVEMGAFQESDFEQGGGHYRVVVDADPTDYNMQNVVSTARRVVQTETSWMNDRPFENYLFIYHFPRGPGGGGMEHAYSTAIEVNAQLLADNLLSLAEVTAHEFFHLWNVKRIRPQSLEPVDYTKENYTTALWFSEGVTNTVQEHALVRAGMLDEAHYLKRLGEAITELKQRPAHLRQSAEESSLDAWLEKYPYYRSAERSVSYYNKGQLLGVMLDLAVREASHGTASLRELFQWMNQNYAKQGKFFPESAGVQQAAETVSHGNLGPFFEKYVAGTEEIPWDDLLKSVGLHVAKRETTRGDPGFTAARNFDAPPVVLMVRPGTDAQRAGLAAGDSILEMNGKAAASDFPEQLELVPAESMLRLRIRRGSREHVLQWRVASKGEVEFLVEDLANVTPQQRSRRTAWLKGEAQAHP